MDGKITLESPSALNRKYACLIGKNLGAVIHELDISQNHLKSIMEERGYNVNQGNLSKYLSGKTAGPLGLLLELADIVKVSVDRLIAADFNARAEAALIRSRADNPAQTACSLHIPLHGDTFVTDPKAPEFRGYLQNYHVYMISPITAERKLISGRMTLSAEGSICKAELTFDDSPTADVSITKFTGQVIISKVLSMAYVFLSNTVTGEIHVLSFRHFQFRPRRQKQLLNSRIAVLLTNGIGEYHSPSVFRMILSRDRILPEHLPLLTPHLYLNGSEIAVSNHALTQLSMVSDEYRTIADHMCKFGGAMTYYWSEDFVQSFAKMALSEEEVPTFISKVREVSNKCSHNKASRRADQMLRELLISLGYYQN